MLDFDRIALLVCVYFGSTSLMAIVMWWNDATRMWSRCLSVLLTALAIFIYLPIRLAFYRPLGELDGLSIAYEYFVVGGILLLTHVVTVLSIIFDRGDRAA